MNREEWFVKLLDEGKPVAQRGLMEVIESARKAQKTMQTVRGAEERFENLERRITLLEQLVLGRS